MPTRLLRDWTDSFAVDSLDVHAERFFVRVIMVADDYGRFHADPRMLRSKCFPLKTDIRDTDITRWLAACEKAGMLRCYHDGQGRALLEIQNFNQRTRTASRYPSPDACPSNDGQMTALGEGVFGGEGEGGTPKAPKGGRGGDLQPDLWDDGSCGEPPPKPAAEGKRVLPKGWEKLSAKVQRIRKVECNNRLMMRIGRFFGRREDTLWTIIEAATLMEVNPSAESVELLESYYLAVIDGDRDHRRKDLITLLNNWNGEADRANTWRISIQ